MWVRAPDRAGHFKKWANDMLSNADVSKPRVNSQRRKSSSLRGRRRKKRRKKEQE